MTTPHQPAQPDQPEQPAQSQQPAEASPEAADAAPSGPTAQEFAAIQAEMGKQLEEAQQEAARNLQGWQRAQADFQNQKNRRREEIDRRVQESQRGLLTDLIELADDFERANSEAPPAEGDSNDAWRQGVEMIGNKLEALLRRQQVHRIAVAEGDQFDTEYQEAIGQLPGRANVIVAVARTGYTHGNHVLRATQVLVGNGAPPPPLEPQAEPEQTPDLIPDQPADHAPDQTPAQPAE